MKFLKYIREKSQDDTEVSLGDEFNYVSSIIRKMAKTQGFTNISIYLDKEELFIMEVVLKQKESFETIIRLMDFIAKIQKDILVGFKCDMELWETKKKEPIFSFEFYQSSINYAPKYDYDDDFPY